MTERFSPSIKIDHAIKFSEIVDPLNKGKFAESVAQLRKHRVAMGNMAGAMNSHLTAAKVEPYLAEGPNATNIADADGRPLLPPEDLRWRVSGHRDAQLFWDTGSLTLANVDAMLAIVGKSIVDYPRTLDFGCGCGRVLLHMHDIARSVEVHGADIDPESIAWCQEHIPWAKAVVNPWRPPLPFPDGHFDLIFNQSVFTHLDEDYQDVWLQELMRVTKPGAAVVLSVAGEGPFADLVEGLARTAPELAAGYVESFRTSGFVFISSDGWNDGPFPAFYHSTFHAPWYIFKHWGRYFDIKAHVVRGSLQFLDYLLLIRRDGPATPTDAADWEVAGLKAKDGVAQVNRSVPTRAYNKLKKLARSALRR